MALVKFWIAVQARINPGIDIVLVDSCSPFPAQDFLAPADGLSIITIDHDIGKRVETGKDGGVEALCVGMDACIAKDKYTHIAYAETDMFFIRPVQSVTERMAKYGIKVTMPFDTMYQFLETGLSFYDIGELVRRNYTKSYDWNNPPEMFHEIWTEWFFGEAIHPLFCRGLRNDLDQINRQNIMQSFPYGIDYLTHCRDPGLYRIMMMMNGIGS